MMDSNHYHQSIIEDLPLHEEVKYLREKLDELQYSQRKDTDWLKAELEKVHQKFESFLKEARSSRTHYSCSSSVPVTTTPDTETSNCTNQEECQLVTCASTDGNNGNRRSDSEQQQSSQHDDSRQERGFANALGSIPTTSQQSALPQQFTSNTLEFSSSSSSKQSRRVFSIKPLQHQSSRIYDRFVNVSNTVGDIGEEEDLETDIYSILMITSTCTLPFFYAMIVACCQFFITVLILIDLLVDEQVVGVRDNNPFNVPSKVEWTVVCAQFLALIVAFVTVDDVITSMKMFIIGYDPEIKEIHSGATYDKFLFSNLIRFLEGMSTIFVSLVIIVVSNDVLEIFMNFVAVAFVSTLDNLAFRIAREGLCGERLSLACQHVIETKVKVQRKSSKIKWAMNLLLFVIFLPFLCLLTSITIRQHNGQLLGMTSCKNLDIRFGDDMYAFPSDVIYSFDGTGINRTFPNSFRPMWHFPEKANPLLYQYFSGNYVAETVDNRLQEFNSRPIYWERGIKDPTSGKFYYCDAIMSWVFAIEAFYDTCGAIPEEARDECQWGWLLQSPSTDAITLDEAPTSNWNIWTGDMQIAQDFSITCTDCQRNSDCGLTHGTCDHDTGTCQCNENRQGRRCNIEQPYCEALVWLHYGETSYEYSEEGLYALTTQEDGSLFTSYERPVYTRPISLSQAEIIAYGGERWFRSVVTLDEIGLLRDVNDTDFYDDFHAYWSNAFDNFVEYFSDPTSSHIPTSIGLTWHRVQESKAKGNFGYFGASYPVNARFVCLDNNCMNNDVCGNFGECVTGMEQALLFNDGGQGQILDIPFHHCQCSNFFGGYFCENRPDGPYSSAMYDEYTANPLAFMEEHQDLEYLKYWVSSAQINWSRHSP